MTTLLHKLSLGLSTLVEQRESICSDLARDGLGSSSQIAREFVLELAAGRLKKTQLQKFWSEASKESLTRLKDSQPYERAYKSKLFAGADLSKHLEPTLKKYYEIPVDSELWIKHMLKIRQSRLKSAILLGIHEDKNFSGIAEREKYEHFVGVLGKELAMWGARMHSATKKSSVFGKEILDTGLTLLLIDRSASCLPLGSLSFYIAIAPANGDFSELRARANSLAMFSFEEVIPMASFDRSFAPDSSVELQYAVKSMARTTAILHSKLELFFES
jgi:hypothetical protein